jgi:hypothetical protein
MSKADLSAKQRAALLNELLVAESTLNSFDTTAQYSIISDVQEIDGLGEAAISIGRVLVEFSELLLNVAVRSLLQTIRSDYDYICDTPNSSLIDSRILDAESETLSKLHAQLDCIEKGLAD